MMEKFTASMRAAPYSRDIVLPEGRARDQLASAMGVAKVQRFQHPGGDVIFVEEQDAVLLNYYRNNVLHLLAIPSLVAAFFAYNDKMREATLVSAVEQFYPLLKQEFFLRWSDESIERTVTTIVATMVDQGLLVRSGDGELSRPAVTSRDLTTLLVLGRCLGQQLERYAIALAILAKRAEVGLPIKADEYTEQVTLMAQRIAILSGLVDAEFYDKKMLLNLVDQLVDLGYLGQVAEGVLQASAKVSDLASKAVLMLSSDIRDSIHRMTVVAPKIS
jgi:glycerol-3-phosphate O-acyltransferase